MEYIISKEQIVNKLRTKIIKLQPLSKQTIQRTLITLAISIPYQCYYFDAITIYGSMSLIVEIYHGQQKYIEQRNQQLKKELVQVTPVIYEQLIVQVKDKIFICLNLIEKIQIVNKQKIVNCINNDKKNNFNNQIYYHTLVMACIKISQHHQLYYHSNCYQWNRLLRSINSGSIYFDFTQLAPNQLCQQNNKFDDNKFLKRQLNNNISKNNLSNNGNNYLNNKQYNLRIFIKELVNILNLIYGNKILLEVIFIRDRIFRRNISALLDATSWIELGLYLNIMKNTEIQIKSKQKIRTTTILKLSGDNIDLNIQNQKYGSYQYLNGKNIHCLTQMTHQQVVSNFLQPSIIYLVCKCNYTLVRKIDSGCSSQHSILQVQQHVSKLECIHFFMTYFKYIDPLLQLIKFYPETNSLYFSYTNQKSLRRTVTMKFDKTHIIKDQELSMIIDRSRIKSGKILLKGMPITDIFLLFLANSEKMKNIIELDLSYCTKITQYGLHSLLSSPSSCNLQILNLSRCPIFNKTIEIISNKKYLTELCINNCQEQDDLINISLIKLIRLQAIGINLQFDFPNTLQYLKLSCPMPFENLKFFKDLALRELQVSINEPKKHLLDLLGSFYHKQSNPIRQFAQGKSVNTLESINLSYSLVRLKLLKPILQMSRLKTIKLEHMQRIGKEVDPITQHINHISLNGSPITVAMLKDMMSKVNLVTSISLNETSINKEQLLQFLQNFKNYINTLKISEFQYSIELFEKNVSCLKSIENIQIFIEKLLEPQKESTFIHLLWIIFKSKKKICIKCQTNLEQLLINKIRIYLTSIPTESFDNLYINDRLINKILNKTSKQSKKDQSSIVIYKPFKKPQKHILKGINGQKNIGYDTLTYNFKKIVNENPNTQIDINIKGNKLLTKDCILMFLDYGCNNIKTIDFQNCMFKQKDVSKSLMKFTKLTEINQGNYEIQWNNKNFIKDSQKQIKFFMQTSMVKSLKIQAYYVNETQIMFTALSHIISHHHKSIKSLSLVFVGNHNCLEAKILWQTIYSIINLHTLSIQIERFPCYLQNICHYNDINKLTQLKYLELKILENYQIPNLKLRNLKQLKFNCNRSNINQQNIYKILKNLLNLNKLQLDCGYCQQLNNLNKLINCITKMNQLEIISFNCEYCPLKDSYLIDFINHLINCVKLKKIELNFSFITHNFKQILIAVNQLHSVLFSVNIQLILINIQSQNFVFNQKQLSIQGINIIV